MYTSENVTEIHMAFLVGIGLAYVAAFLVIIMFVKILGCCRRKKKTTEDGKAKVTTVKNIEFSEEDLNFDLYLECGKRIWQPFWENLFECI